MYSIKQNYMKHRSFIEHFSSTLINIYLFQIKVQEATQPLEAANLHIHLSKISLHHKPP